MAAAPATAVTADLLEVDLGIPVSDVVHGLITPGDLDGFLSATRGKR